MPITSSKNALLQEVRRAAALGRPTEDGFIVAEGPHLAEEALRGRWDVEQFLVAQEFRSRYAEFLRQTRAEVIEVSERAFAATATTQTHQGIITLLRPRNWRWDDLMPSPALMVALDGIQDPGNAGTILRSAEAFGATGVVFLRGSVRVANGKLLRAAAGSAFRIPFLEEVAGETFLSMVRKQKMALYALSADAAADVSDIDFLGSAALVLGSEGAGLSAEIGSGTQAVRIPVQSVESLNVGIAGSIALFEAARQRRSAE